jgi:hypothetical protein
MYDTNHHRSSFAVLLAFAFALCLLVSGCGGHKAGTTGGFSGTRTTALSGCTEKLNVKDDGTYTQHITNRLHGSTDNGGKWTYGVGPSASADRGPWLVLSGDINSTDWCQSTAPVPEKKKPEKKPDAAAAGKSRKSPKASGKRPGAAPKTASKPPPVDPKAQKIKKAPVAVKKADVLISTRGFDGHLDPALQVKNSTEDSLPPKTTDVRAQIAWLKRHKEWFAPPVMFVILWLLTLNHALKHSKWLWLMFVAFVSCVGVPLYWLFGWWSTEDTGSPPPLPKEPRPAEDPELEEELRKHGSAHDFEA